MAWFFTKLGVAAILVWIVASIVFLAIYLVPGDPALVLLSTSGGTPDAKAVEQLREELGLNRPVPVQYASHMIGLLKGDLGRSMQDGSSVSAEIARRLPRTLELLGVAALISIVVGGPTGILAASRRGGLFDRIGSAVSAGSLAVPVFVLGTVFVMLFAQKLRWVPAGGYVAFLQAPVQHVILLLMPAITLALGLTARVFRMTRTAALDVLTRDYVRTAHAKGLTVGQVLARHVARNAAAPALTVLALDVGSLLGGSVLVEYVFNWPGLSGMLVTAVNARDYTAVVGVVLVISILFVLLNLFVELVYGLLDPRVRRA